MTALRPSALLMTTFVFAAAGLFAAAVTPLLQIAAQVVV